METTAAQLQTPVNVVPSQPVNQQSYPSAPATPATTSPTVSKKFWRTPLFIGSSLALVLVLIVGMGLSNIFVRPRTISMVGKAKLTFPVEKAELTILYSKKGVDTRATAAEGELEFQRVLASIRHENVQVFKTHNQITPTPTGSEYRQGAVVKITGNAAILSTLASLNNEPIILAQANYLPADDVTTQSQLLDAALENAETKAVSVAKQNNFRVGKLLSIVEGSSVSDTSNTLSSQNTTTSQSQIELEKIVTVTYEVKNKLIP